jgi:hypothetical protein
MKKKKFTNKELEYIDKLMSGGMDRVRAEDVFIKMKTYKSEDYKKAEDILIEMMGEPLEDVLKAIKEYDKERTRKDTRR